MTRTAPTVRAAVKFMPFSAADEIGSYFDQVGEPNNIHLEVRMPGHFDQARLRTAVAAALSGHPGARVRRAAPRPFERRRRWEFTDGLDVDPLTIADTATPADLDRARREFLGEAPDLGSAPPIRLLLAVGPAGDTLFLNAHHAAIDGGSCILLIHSIAHRYNDEPDSTPTPIPGSAPAKPANTSPSNTAPSNTAPSNTSPAKPPKPANTAPAKPAKPADTTPANTTPANTGPASIPAGPGAVYRPARIAGRTGTPGPGYGYQMTSLERPSRQARALLDPSATANDLLLAAFALTVARWDAICGRPPTGTIRITVPINDRLHHGRGAGVGNFSRLAAVTVLPADRADPARLVGRIAAQTRAAKATPGSPVGLMGAVLAPAWLPVAIKRHLAGPLRRTLAAFTDTAKVSNWGHFREPLRFGDAGTADEIWASGPAPMPRGLSVTVVTYGDRLQLTFRHRFALMDADAAEAFADLYRDTYTELLTPTRPATHPATRPATGPAKQPAADPATDARASTR